jgi:hypothetical protein
MDLYFFVKKYRLQIKMVNIYKKNIKKKCKIPLNLVLLEKIDKWLLWKLLCL